MYQGFLRYVICNPNFTAYIKAVHTGTSIPHISGGQIAAYPVSVPPLREQQAIACILGALDDKIELNRRRNETLEGMARALFQSWFVDFDPVRAKSAGRTPHGLKPELAELFPDSFEVSAVGEIPKGWYEAKLGEVADVNWGDTSVTKSAYTDRGFTAYSAKGPDGLLPYFDFDRVGIVVSAIGANSGFTWLARGKWSCIKNTLRFWATDQDISTEYLFFATHGNNIWPLRGSAQPFIAQADARNLRVLYPLRSIARRFGELVDPFLSQSQANDCESRSLAALRDTLLPKLISGEMRVPDAERIVGRAT
jgi:type I restriction enzyme S subunit